jgi:type I restriction enzyme R subunit
VKGFVAESGVEEVCLEYFADLGWGVLHGPDIAPDEPAAERSSYRDVLLEGRLRAAISWLNPWLTNEAFDQVVATVRRAESADVLAENWRVHRLLTQGVPVEVRDQDGGLRHELAWLIDFEHLERNDFAVVNQMSVEQDDKTRRPDVLAFVNGLPLGLIELKVPGQEGATLRGAWNQLRTYAAQIPGCWPSMR